MSGWAPRPPEDGSDDGLEVPPVGKDLRSAAGLDAEQAGPVRSASQRAARRPCRARRGAERALRRLRSASNARRPSRSPKPSSRPGADPAATPSISLMPRVDAFVLSADLDLAVQVLDAVTEIAPDNARPGISAGIVHFMQNDTDRALTDLRRALAIDPRHYKAMRDLGAVLQQTGDKKGALEAYRKALEINPFLEQARRVEDSSPTTSRGGTSSSSPSAATFSSLSSLTTAMRNMLVAPGVPSGTPAEMITRCPRARSLPDRRCGRPLRPCRRGPLGRSSARNAGPKRRRACVRSRGSASAR